MSPSRLPAAENRALEAAWAWGDLEPRADKKVYVVDPDGPKEPVCSAALAVEMVDRGWFKPIAKGKALRFRITALGRDVQAGVRLP